MPFDRRFSRCYKCKRKLNKTKFSKHSGRSTGVAAACKDCSKVLMYNYYEKTVGHKGPRIRKSDAEYRDTYHFKNPWVRFYSHIYARCNYKRHESYKYYGGKGIKLYLTVADLKTLWFRDRAFKMVRPSIDRIDSNGHYSLKNCRFIELSKNLKRRWRYSTHSVCLSRQ